MTSGVAEFKMNLPTNNPSLFSTLLQLASAWQNGTWHESLYEVEVNSPMWKKEKKKNKIAAIDIYELLLNVYRC